MPTFDKYALLQSKPTKQPVNPINLFIKLFDDFLLFLHGNDGNWYPLHGADIKVRLNTPHRILGYSIPRVIRIEEVAKIIGGELGASPHNNEIDTVEAVVLIGNDSCRTSLPGPDDNHIPRAKPGFAMQSITLVADQDEIGSVNPSRTDVESTESGYTPYLRIPGCGRYHNTYHDITCQIAQRSRTNAFRHPISNSEH